MSKRLLAKLEKYEHEAYDSGFGTDWLSDIGEGFKIYIEDCVENDKQPTIKGFEKRIDELHKERQ